MEKEEDDDDGFAVARVLLGRAARGFRGLTSRMTVNFKKQLSRIRILLH